MKILQINAVYEYSSTGRTTTELHNYLLSKGIESFVAACNVSNSDRLYKFGNKLTNSIHSVLSHVTGKQGFFSYCSTIQLIKKIKEIEPDVVHLRVLHSNCVNLPLLLNYLGDNDIPTVITLHDCWYFTGHCCYFVDTNCDRWKKGCGKCPDLKNWNTSWFFDCTKGNLASKKRLFSKIPRLAVVGVSDWVTNFIRDSILKEALVVKRIYNWIDVERFKPSDNDVRTRLKIEDEFVILGVAQNWSVQKGIEDIKTIAKMLPYYKLVLVGNVPEEFHPLPPNIIEAGVTSSVQDLIHYYSTADVFFNPSTRETFGKVTAESLSCGTPVVAYNATATPELINKNCGFIVEPHDFEKTCDVIKMIHKEGKKRYTTQCRQYATDNFNRIKLMNDYIELYTSLIQEKKI